MKKFVHITLCMAILTCHPARALEPLNMTGTYYIEWNAIPLAKLWMHTEQDDQSYDFTASLKSRTITRIFKKIKALTKSHGILTEHGWQVLHYKTTSQHDEGEKYTELHYDEAGNLTYRKLSHEDDPNYRPRVKDADAKGSVTYGNALFVLRDSLHQALQRKEQEFIQHLYDGKRLMEVHATIDGQAEYPVQDKLKPAYRVHLQRRLLSGFTQKELDRYEEGDPIATLYFSKDTALMPIGLEVDIAIGRLRGFWQAE